MHMQALMASMHKIRQKNVNSRVCIRQMVWDSAVHKLLHLCVVQLC